MTVGVLGGMGPEATIDFLQKVVSYTPARVDQDHLRLLIDNNPKVPNRQAAILHEGENPGPILASMAKGLETQGADFLVAPCNSADAFLDHVRNAVSIPVISIVDVTASRAAAGGFARVGILATDGCLAAGSYQSALEDRGLRWLVPQSSHEARLMRAIAAIKAGEKTSPIHQELIEVASALVERGAEAIISGCTEIPLLLTSRDLPVEILSSTDVLAQTVVKVATGRVMISSL